MRINKGQVRAPEIGRVWLNSPPFSLRQLRGQAVLIDFWDYTCVNCIRTLPYLEAWHQRYRDKGLVVIGAHTPEFTFARYESNVERGVREFGLTYPVVVDSNFELWKAYANRYWPAKYLIDGEGYLRYVHFGEGQYQETESVIQELLREISPAVELPPLLEPARAEDRPGAVCYPPTPELYLGHRRGRMGNPQSFVEDAVADYSFTGDLHPDVFYAQGRFRSTAEYLESASEAGGDRVALHYSAAAVNLVMSAGEGAAEVMIRQDGQPLTRERATADTQFRATSAGQESYLRVETPRMYFLVDNRAFEQHTLELEARAPGLALFAFTFTSCVRQP